MHHSRLSTFVIDCDTEDMDAAADFWSRALGRQAAPLSDGESNYRELRTHKDEQGRADHSGSESKSSGPYPPGHRGG